MYISQKIRDFKKLLADCDNVDWFCVAREWGVGGDFGQLSDCRTFLCVGGQEVFRDAADVLIRRKQGRVPSFLVVTFEKLRKMLPSKLV